MADLRTELLAIRAKRGLLTPRIVMEEARPRNHPLHDKVFDVGKDQAAERYYLSNARRLLQVTFRTDLGGRPADLRAFWVQKGDEESPESHYVPIEEIAANPISKQIMLQQMRRDWQRFRARYEMHQEFVELLEQEWTDLNGNGDDPANGTEG